MTANPPWLYGVLPDPVTGESVGAKSCAIIVNDHGNGLIDAYYMYFYAFNLGETVLGQVLGDHVGDWEHSMVRFQNGLPISVWLSQHDVSYCPNTMAMILRRYSTGKRLRMTRCQRKVLGQLSIAPSALTPIMLSLERTPGMYPS